MIRDAFYEESAACARAAKEAKLYTLFKVSAIVFFVFLGIILSFAFTWVSMILQETTDTVARVFNLVTYFGFALLILGGGLLLWFMKNRFNQSYDYVFVEDELRVSRVYNGKKRKFLKTMKCDQMLKLGKCENDSFERTCAGLSKKQIIFLTPNREPSENKNFYYILYSSSVEKTVNIIEVRVEMIDYLVRAAGRNKWEAR